MRSFQYIIAVLLSAQGVVALAYGPNYGGAPYADPYSNGQNYGYGDAQPYRNQPQAYGNQPQAYGNQPQAYGNQPQAYGNQPQAYGNQPQAYGNQVQPYYPPQPTYSPNVSNGFYLQRPDGSSAFITTPKSIELPDPFGNQPR